MNSDVSEGEEAYLKRALEAFEDNPSEIVKTSDLAARLNVSSASVTEMIKKLAARDLVTHIPYRGSRLTSKGFRRELTRASSGRLCSSNRPCTLLARVFAR